MSASIEALHFHPSCFLFPLSPIFEAIGLPGRVINVLRLSSFFSPFFFCLDRFVLFSLQGSNQPRLPSPTKGVRKSKLGK